MLNRLLISVLAFSLYAPVARAGGRVNNGGLGVDCGPRARGGSGTWLVDVFERGLSRDWVTDRKALGEEVFHRLRSSNEEFASEWKAEWERIGDSASWPTGSAAEDLNSYDGFLPFDQRQLVDCRIIQISSFALDKERPTRIRSNWLKLDDAGRRALELHESLYFLGIRRYGHTNPVRVRELTAALLGDHTYSDPAALAKLILSFRNRLLPDASTTPTWLPGTYRSTSPSTSRCPPMLAAEATGLAGPQLFLAFTSSRLDFIVVSLRLQNSRSLVATWDQSTRFDRRPDGSSYVRFESPNYALTFRTSEDTVESFVAEFSISLRGEFAPEDLTAFGCGYRRTSEK